MQLCRQPARLVSVQPLPARMMPAVCLKACNQVLKMQQLSDLCVAYRTSRPANITSCISSASTCSRSAPTIHTAALWVRCFLLKDRPTVAVLNFCAHADEEAPCMKQEHAYARLAMPFDKLQKRHGSGDTSTSTRCLCDAVIMQDAHLSCLAANLISYNFIHMCCAACRYWLFDDKLLCRFFWHQSSGCTCGAPGILRQPGQTEAQHFGDI